AAYALRYTAGLMVPSYLVLGLVLLSASCASSRADGGGSTSGAVAATGGESEASVPSPVLARREPAPEFVLYDQEGFPYPIAESRGRWVVLHFYPESDTPDCACDATAFTGHLWRFNGLEAEVACVTSSPEGRTLRYAKKYGLSFPLLSDPDLAVTSLYGAARDGSIVRTTLLIDPEGRIAARWDDVKSNEHVETLLDALRELRGS
ncbi:MAG: peroxiredoxin, partial [Planctomycetota bacterium]